MANGTQQAQGDWVDDLLKAHPGGGAVDWVDELLKPKAATPAKPLSDAFVGPSTALGSIPMAGEEAFHRASTTQEIPGSKLGPDGLPVPTTRTRQPNLLAPTAVPVTGLGKHLVDVSQFIPSTLPRTKATAEVAESFTSPE